jgi:hypothetical protein
MLCVDGDTHFHHSSTCTDGLLGQSPEPEQWAEIRQIGRQAALTLSLRLRVPN